MLIFKKEIFTLLAFTLLFSYSHAKDGLKKATFAGGCFWCMESPFEKLDGVVEVISGYTGGKVKNPSYKEVSAGGTGHLESIQITYDPKKISYGELAGCILEAGRPNRCRRDSL